MDRLKARQKTFFEDVTGGPGGYDLDRIGGRHASHGIDTEAYDVFMGHFEDTLDAFEVPTQEREELLEILHGYRGDVIAE